MSKFKNILITGAGSGLGQSLTIELSKTAENIFICGRNLEKLQQTKLYCKNSPANIHEKILDVKDQFAIQQWIDEIEQNHPIDLVIANAGISAGTANGSESQNQINEIFQTNFFGVINTINPLISKMQNRQSGQIVIISSMASFIALPSSPAYSSSKVAIRYYGEALRINLQQFNIKVNIVCPGYIKTPMTAVNNFYMPFLMDCPTASKKIIRGIEKNQSVIIFPKILFYVINLKNLLPQKILEYILSKLPKKSGLEKIAS